MSAPDHPAAAESVSGYVPCGFTPWQTVRYRQGFDRAERTIVEVLPRFYTGWDAAADGVTVSVGGSVLPASWFEAVEVDEVNHSHDNERAAAALGVPPELICE